MLVNNVKAGQVNGGERLIDAINILVGGLWSLHIGLIRRGGDSEKAVQPRLDFPVKLTIIHDQKIKKSGEAGFHFPFFD